VLEGSVWKTAERIRISVNLVAVKDGFNLWAQRFDSNLGDVFTIQDEVCSAVAEAMHIRLASQPPKAHLGHWRRVDRVNAKDNLGQYWARAVRGLCELHGSDRAKRSAGEWNGGL
jgi:hypothetical protein